MNFDLILELLAYDGAATNIPSDAIRVRNRTQDSTIENLSRVQFAIADSTDDQSLSLPDTSVLYTIILCDREITLKVNGSDDAITLTPRANGTRTFVYFTRGTVTALSVSNNSGATCNLDVITASK